MALTGQKLQDKLIKDATPLFAFSEACPRDENPYRFKALLMLKQFVKQQSTKQKMHLSNFRKLTLMKSMVFSFRKQSLNMKHIVNSAKLRLLAAGIAVLLVLISTKHIKNKHS